jgi:diguanylate cyclase (GGDEF)-like protein
MLDIDHFKSVNDNYGHAVGDEVLRVVGRTIAGALRVSDMPARWGGEEFCVLLPDTDAAGGAIALQKALAAVRDLVFHPDEGAGTFGVTFSAGVAAVLADQPGPHAVEAADALLYEAKASGRNCVLTAASASTPPRPHAVVADDDVEVRGVLAKTLERQGYAVTLCNDGRQAVSVARSTHVALAVLDLDMPNMNGFETLQALRATPLLARLPILMLTGSHEEADLVKGFDLGVSDYMTKPLRVNELVARVRRLMNRR